MPTKLLSAATLGLLLACAPRVAVHQPADTWWRHVTVLADDSLLGRQTGSAGGRAAARYVAGHFQRAGLRPGGVDGYLQPVRFTVRTVDESRSRLTLVRAGGATEDLVLGDDATLGMRAPHAARVEASVVFIGFGLTVPDHQYDDLAGLDLRGKVVLFVSGGPPAIPGPVLAHSQNVRWEALRRAGAVGTIGIQNPRNSDIPWDRSMLARLMPAMSLADTALAASGAQISAVLNARSADKLLAGSGHTIAELLATADSGKRLPRFALPVTLRADIASTTERVESDNVVGILPGSDPALSREYVVLTSHYDHLGAARQDGREIIHPGALDNASGVATLLETVTALTARGVRPKRSIVFLAVTAEEKGLLGSRYFARYPTIPRPAIVAALNVDMPLPLYPLRSVIVPGLEESDLAADVRRAAAARGIRVLADPEPLRNAFVRSDQYSFIREGVPSMAIKVGFDVPSAEHEMVKRWRAERYHSPTDDLAQPIDRRAAEDFNALYLALVREIADRPTRPSWNADSFFRRLAER